VSAKTLATGEFKFALPPAVLGTADGRTVRATLGNGQPLPAWLHYSPETKSFVASSVPAGALPLEVIIYVGEQRWVFKINAQT
jgi:hypothetical protein